MLSKNPLEPFKESFSAADDLEAARLAVVAEIDAINLYEQLASRVKDETLRRVLLDVAEEEKVHLGEFMEVVKRLDSTQAGRLEEGAREVASLAAGAAGGGGGARGPGRGDPQPQAGPLAADELSALLSYVRGVVESLRALSRALPSLSLPAPSIAVPAAVVSDSDVIRSSLEPLAPARLFERLAVAQEELELYRAARQAVPPSVQRAAARLAMAEESAVFGALSSAARVRVSGKLAGPGSFASLISQALEQVQPRSASVPALVLGPQLRARLASIVDAGGVTELQRASALVSQLVVTPGAPPNQALLLPLSPDVADLVRVGDVEVEYAGYQAGAYSFELSERLAVRVKVPEAVALLVVEAS